jgi:hypothetical protein
MIKNIKASFATKHIGHVMLDCGLQRKMHILFELLP